MTATLKYLALVASLLIAVLSLLVMLAAREPASPIAFPQLAMVALQIIFYLLAVYELFKNNFKLATIYTGLSALSYMGGALYSLVTNGLAFMSQIPGAFYEGLAFRSVITAICFYLFLKTRPPKNS